MAFDDYHRYDGRGLADLIRTRQVSAREVLEAALARADHLNPRLNAIIHRMDDTARAAPVGTGPLGGVPFLVKDLVQLVKGEPYRAGSRFLGEKAGKSYVVPAKRIVELCERLGQGAKGERQDLEP